MAFMEGIKFSANTQEFIEFILGYVTFDKFSVDWVVEKIYDLPEMDTLSINFEACGVETPFFIINIGSPIWIVLGTICIAIVSLLFFLFKNHAVVEAIWNRLGRPLYWNGLIRLFNSVYQDFALLSIVNLV